MTRTPILTLIVAVGVIGLSEAPGEPGKEQPKERKEIALVVLRGRIIDINAELKKEHGVDISANVETLRGFKTGDGRIYTLLKTRNSLALFTDKRLWERELILKGRLFQSSHLFEATVIQSVHKGVVHDLYYYCDICAIKSLTQEVCACCQEPVRLVEEAVNRTQP
jgi:hypothetical protein